MRRIKFCLSHNFQSFLHFSRHHKSYGRPAYQRGVAARGVPWDCQRLRGEAGNEPYPKRSASSTARPRQSQRRKCSGSSETMSPHSLRPLSACFNSYRTNCTARVPANSQKSARFRNDLPCVDHFLQANTILVAVIGLGASTSIQIIRLRSAWKIGRKASAYTGIIVLHISTTTRSAIVMRFSNYTSLRIS